MIDFPEPIGIVCLSTGGPGKFGQWRKFTHDRLYWGFHLAFEKYVTKKLDSSDKDDMHRREIFLRTAQHIPMTFEFFDPSQPDFEKTIFTRSMQTVEDLRIKEGTLSHDAWEMCLNMAQLREFNKDASGDDSATAVEKYLCDEVQFNWARSSEHAVKKGNRSTDNMLMIHDRIEESGAKDLLVDSRTLMPTVQGKKNVFQFMPKLLVIVQKAGSDSKKLIRPQ